jgi:hypothetical protein
MSAAAHLADRRFNFGAIRRGTSIRRTAFSCPDLELSEPDCQ